MAVKRENSGGQGAEFFHAEMLSPVDESGGRAGVGRGKSIIPVGIFLMLFFIEAMVAVGVSLAYFVYSGSSGIREIESQVRFRSLPLAQELAEEAGASLKKKDYSGLRSLFVKNEELGLIDEGFFLLPGGKRAVHVVRGSGGEPRGNSWSHSAELILASLKKESGETMMIDYSAPALGLPFTADIRLLMRRFLYPGIDWNAWLVTRAVFLKEKPAGSVGFIISKQMLYDFIESHVRFSLFVLAAALGAALAISLMVSFVVFLRYRSLRRVGSRSAPGGVAARDEFYDVPLPAVTRASSPARDDAPMRPGAGIRDAIPVVGKE